MSPRRSSRARAQRASKDAGPSASKSSAASARADHQARSSTSHPSSKSSSASSTYSWLSRPEAEPDDWPGHRPKTYHTPPAVASVADEGHEMVVAREESLVQDDYAGYDTDVTRCVCGQLEYPGPPLEGGPAPQLNDVDDVQNADGGGLYIQCDLCKVWQHGGCIGFMDAAATPDEYFCERCRDDLHHVKTNTAGLQYSRYLATAAPPPAKKPRKKSTGKDTDAKSKQKTKNPPASEEPLGKRRSTMNSRSTYADEFVRTFAEEKLEESRSQSAHGAESVRGTGEDAKEERRKSREEGAGGSADTSWKKRSRDESVGDLGDEKRPRTGAGTLSATPAAETEDKQASKPAKQKARGAAARSQREKEQREKERERAEAASRRKGRVDRRRGDDVEQTVQEASVPASTSEPAPAAPPPVPQPAPPRKSARAPPKRKGRLGRNQYTRDAPTPSRNGVSPTATPQPAGAVGAGTGHDSSDGTNGGPRNSKGKPLRLDKLSWNDIHKPAAMMQNFIAQRQLELAGKHASHAAFAADTPRAMSPAPAAASVGPAAAQTSFAALNTLQMMDALSRDLAHWQRKYGQLN